MLSPYSIKLLAALLLAVSSLSMIHSHTLAQAAPQADPGRLVQLTDDELRTTLRGASTRALGDSLHIEYFGCGEDWSHIGFRAPAYGRYSIRDNQFCVEATVGANFRVCAKILRGETGRMFLQGVSQDGQEMAPPGEITITPASQACSR